jgi:murein DD-endopeptidase MepM/ murein hydrolase activator NlpD
VSEEIITHSTLVGKLLVKQSIDIPAYTDKIDGYTGDKEKTVKALSRSRAAAYAGATLKGTVYKIREQAVMVRNGLDRVTPRPIKLFFAFIMALVSAGADYAGEKLHVAGRSVSRVRYGISRRIACYCAPRAAGMLFLTVSVFLVVSTSLVGVGLQVYIDGKPVGFVSRRSDFTEVVSRVESNVSQILGYPYSLDADVSYNIEMFNRKEKIDLKTAEKMLFSGISDIKQAYVVTVDGEVIGANASKKDIDLILNGFLSKKNAGENSDKVEFVRNVQVSLQYTNTKNIKTINDLSQALSSNVRDEATYKVQSGDVFGQIAEDHGLSAEALAAMNPGVDTDHIKAGQALVVEEAIPLMSIRTTHTKVAKETIPFKTEYVNDNTLLSGIQKVKVKGIEGKKEVTTETISVDGKVESATVLNEKILSEPTTEVVRVGTKQRAPTGTYIIPYHGSITSRFGARIFRGRYDFHTGIDFAGPKGSIIVASDGGTVTKAGWYGPYGYAVIINHGNGVQTLYGHTSKILVKVGQKVAQGEAIARVGSTGRSTGPHCHFEIRINGKAINPAKYLW